MKARTHAADYYRRILSGKPHALKRLDAFAKIVLCNRGQEIPNNPGPAGHWYYVIAGAVRRCAVRSDGRLEKVGSFLLSLDVRASNTSGQVVLPVSRYDIADHLAMSVETVCRSFTYLQQRGAIALAGKRPVKILNRSALEDRVAESSLGAAI
jgi:hypothetical protein